MAKPTVSTENKKKLARLVCDAVKMSDEKLSKRVKEWDESERVNQAYIPAADAERNSKRKGEEFSFTKLVIPYSYAMMMAEHTYLTSIFLGRPNPFQLAGRNGTGQNEVLAMEAILDYQNVKGEMLVPLYIGLYDLSMYGLAVVGSYWDTEVVSISTWEETNVEVAGVVSEETETTYVEVNEELYNGGKLFNVKPKEMIIDPRVGFVKFQTGEFFGRRVTMSTNELKNNPDFFDVEFIDKNGGYPDAHDSENPALTEPDRYNSVLDPEKRKNFARLYELYVKLVPNDYGLSPNKNEEIWCLTVANGSLLIGANPSGWLHGRFPYDIMVREFDGYTLSSRGIPEIGRPMNDTMNWLVNSHMFNVERSLNNEFIFDPSIINAKDFLDPLPGKRVRLRPEGYGKDIRNSFMQIPQHDVTQSHLQDIRLVEAMFQRVFGINDQMLGALASGGRKTATEVRSAAGFGLNRLKSLSEFISVMFFGPLTRKLVSNSRQMYDAETKFKIVQDEGMGNTAVDVSVEDIVGEFDFAPVDGAMPIDRMAQTMIYKELLMAMQSLPAIAGRYDVAQFFAYTAKLAGVKNLSSFEIQLADQQKIANEAALGNLVIGGKGGQTASRDGGASPDGAGIAGTPTASGMGPVG